MSSILLWFRGEPRPGSNSPVRPLDESGVHGHLDPRIPHLPHVLDLGRPVTTTGWLGDREESIARNLTIVGKVDGEPISQEAGVEARFLFPLYAQGLAPGCPGCSVRSLDVRRSLEWTTSALHRMRPARDLRVPYASRSLTSPNSSGQ